MSASGDPLDALPAAVLADVLGRVADAGDIAACRIASRTLLAASYLCPRVRLCAADCARRRRVEGRARAPAFRATTGNLASLLGAHLRSLSLDAADGEGSPDDAMWVEEGEFEEADDLHLTGAEALAAWAGTAAGPVLRELEIADYLPQACWRKAEALPLISHYSFAMDLYEKLEKVGEGTYGKVYKAREKATGRIVALKKMWLPEDDEGVPPTAPREVSLLRMLSQDPHVVRLLDLKQGINKEGQTILYLVFEYMDTNLEKFIQSHRANQEKIPALTVKVAGNPK